MDSNHYRIGKVLISRTSITDSYNRVMDAVKQRRNIYICISNVRTTVYANRHPAYNDVMRKAFMCTPDGMPLVWAARLWGLKEVERTCGPDLFIKLLKTKTVSHFFLGDTEQVLSQLVAKCNTEYGSCVAGSYSPPFCPVDGYDYKSIAEKINTSGADIVWIALGAPKQDLFAEKLSPLLNNKVQIQIGAAFRFVLGEYRHPPMIFRKLGLTGLFWRFKSHPFAETWWYVKHITLFSLLLGQIVCRRITGQKSSIGL